jgi:2,3-bisphosphoglycerate-independent phosphoglycerate mutase
MERARSVLADHEVNVVRRDLSENPATDIWLWGQGRAASLPSFESRFGVRGAVIAAVDLIRGIARCAAMDVIDVPGATGYLDTDYAAKGRHACAALRAYDLVAVHIEAPDEAGHLGDAAAKAAAIGFVDEHVVGPLLAALREFGPWRILIAPDHPTPVGRRVHTDAPPPFCMAGAGITPVLDEAFSEQAALRSGVRIERGYELMERFLGG